MSIFKIIFLYIVFFVGFIAASAGFGLLVLDSESLIGSLMLSIGLIAVYSVVIVK